MTHETLEQIEGVVWPDPPADSAPMVARCHILRKVPLDQLTPGDLRLLLGQYIGVDQLAPLALAVLRREPLVEGDHFAGDLLTNVLDLLPEFWEKNVAALEEVKAVGNRALCELRDGRHLYPSDIELVQDIEEFLASHAA